MLSHFDNLNYILNAYFKNTCHYNMLYTTMCYVLLGIHY